MKEAIYVYSDVVKTFGDDMKIPWQWNPCAHWSFQQVFIIYN